MSALPDGIHDFLGDTEWEGAEIAPLVGDASFRRYFRLRMGGHTAMLMHAPPPHEDPAPFLHVAHWLEEQGMRGPAILLEDAANGWVLTEDFGDQRMKEWIDDHPGDEHDTYAQAIDALVQLHQLPPGPFDQLHLGLARAGRCVHEQRPPDYHHHQRREYPQSQEHVPSMIFSQRPPPAAERPLGSLTAFAGVVTDLLSLVTPPAAVAEIARSVPCAVDPLVDRLAHRAEMTLEIPHAYLGRSRPSTPHWVAQKNNGYSPSVLSLPPTASEPFPLDRTIGGSSSVRPAPIGAISQLVC